MNPFLLQGLQKLNENDRIEIVYKPDGQPRTVTGIVTGTDHTEFMAVQSDDGSIDYLAFNDAVSFKILPKTVPPTPPVLGGTETPPLPPPPKRPPLPSTSYLSRDISNLTVNYSNYEMKNFFLSLTRDEKQQLQRSYDSFMNAANQQNMQKMVMNARRAHEVIMDGYDKDMRWSPNALKVCCGMMYRANRFEGENQEPTLYDYYLFVSIRGLEMYPEAAIYSYAMRDYVRAGAFASIALANHDDEELDDLLTILGKSIIKTKDASAFRYLQDNLPQDEFDGRFSSLIEDLLSRTDIHITGETRATDFVRILLTQFTGDAMLEFLQEFLEIDGSKPGSPLTPPVPDPEPNPSYLGWISYVIFGGPRGEITCDDHVIPFQFSDVQDKELLTRLRTSTSSTLSGVTAWVRFDLINGSAKNIVSSDSPFREAKKCADSYDYVSAMELCVRAKNSPDAPEALAGIVEYAMAAYISDRERNKPLLKDAEQIYVENYDSYPRTAKALSLLARLYHALADFPRAIECMEQTLSLRGITTRMRATYLNYYISYCQQQTNEVRDDDLLEACIDRANEWLELYQNNPGFQDDPELNSYYPHILARRCHSACVLGRLDDAESSLKLLAEAITTPRLQEVYDKRLAEVEALRKNLGLPLLNNSDVEDIPTKGEPSSGTDGIDGGETSTGGPNDSGGTEGPVTPPPPPPPSVVPKDISRIEDEIEEEHKNVTVPYEDREGWAALGLTEEEVVKYSLNLTGEQAVPYALTYLRAAAQLNPKLQPVYEMMALAANDPAYAADYSLSGLFNMLDATGPAYQNFGDYCMSAAFLRTSFQSGRDYDYSARTIRDSIAPLQANSLLLSVCDTLEEFRSATQNPIDIYADYRSHGVKQLNEERAALVRRARDLYAYYIDSDPRESILIIAKTKKNIFNPNTFMATLLRAIRDQDQASMDKVRGKFIEDFMSSGELLSERAFSLEKIDSLIADAWDEAGREKTSGRRVSGSLQGERRNNLRSNVTDVLKLVCQWYNLCDQSAGLAWRTAEGEDVYTRLKPQLIKQLGELSDFCRQSISEESDGQKRMGLYVLDRTARELTARLTGDWFFGEEKYTYVDFLRRDDVLLDQDFIPEISSTFCVLPDFNILARIRAHVEGNKPEFGERIQQIFSPDRTRNNYLSAKQIEEYLTAYGEVDGEILPDNFKKYNQQTRQQVYLRYRSFLETYALAINYGQILQSDPFCYTLEDTVKYWFKHSMETRNYGFFISFLKYAEVQIHTSAQQYGAMLEEQLDSLIENNRAEFDQNPGYEAAIREQISQQNFIVAEDWMNRIRAHDFSLALETPFALKLLNSFAFHYSTIYQHVFNIDGSLENELASYRHTFKSEKAQKLIHTWMGDEHAMDAERITELLNLLGWPSIQVTPADLPDAHAEIYHAKQDVKMINKAAPPHPIAAFGSNVAKDGMYVVCLYSSYNADSLYEKIRALDKIDGNKVILLDCAFSVVDRHAIARKLKQRESGIKNVYLLIDRVALCFLADNYSEELVNRNLMAIGTPYSYCMPYVVASSHNMPPEIFIGRKYELAEIESPTGVNLIYGGRQLGKSALFKKVRDDLDGDQGRRAILVDIVRLGIEASAKKVSKELVDNHIIPEEEETNDWGRLADSIRTALRNHDEIRYLILMLDEADDFIKDCGNVNYDPIVKLKDVQQTLPGRFKFVLAGLHNIIRFNRSVALGNNSVITHMPYLKVTPFKAPEAEDLLKTPLSYLGLSLPSKVTISQILATVNYFPGLIQLYAQKLVESLRAYDYAGYDQRVTPPYVITDDHLRRVMADKDFVHEIHSKFEATLTLGQDEGFCYYPIALIFGIMYNEEPQKAKQTGFSAEDVYRYAKYLDIDQIVNLDMEILRELLNELEDLNILRSISSSTYLLASKGFRDLLGSSSELYDKLSKFSGVKS